MCFKQYYCKKYVPKFRTNKCNDSNRNLNTSFCNVLDKFKQMLKTISAFCMVNGKKEKAIGEYSVKNMK